LTSIFLPAVDLVKADSGFTDSPTARSSQMPISAPQLLWIANGSTNFGFKGNKNSSYGFSLRL